MEKWWLVLVTFISSVILSSVPEILFFLSIELLYGQAGQKTHKKGTMDPNERACLLPHLLGALPQKTVQMRSLPQPANACFNNDCSDINSATQKLLQSSETISLEVGANDDDKTTVTELQRFLFMINQFEKFIPNIAEKSKPLQELLNKKQSRTCGSFQDDVLQN